MTDQLAQPAQEEQTEPVKEPLITVEDSATEQEEEPLEPESTLLGESTLTYFTSDEAQYNGIIIAKTTVDELLSLLGEPVSFAEEMDSQVYNYEDATYYMIEMFRIENGLQIPYSIVNTIFVKSRTDAPSPRGIRVGDSFEEVLNKFPQEKDFLSSAGGYFYGSDVWNEPVGYVSKFDDETEIIVSAGPYDDALKIYFEADRVTSYLIFWPD